MLDHLWAGWRIPYIEGESGVDTTSRVEIPEGLSLFEAIEASGLPDDETYVVWRGPTCFALLNAYPYTSGHLLVLPRRAVARLDGLTPVESAELWATVRDAVAALESAYRPDGVNVGMNLGRGAGAGIPDHLHVHVLPRWTGDTNFMTTVANVRVLPEALVDSWRRLRRAWPSVPDGGGSDAGGSASP